MPSPVPMASRTGMQALRSLPRLTLGGARTLPSSILLRTATRSASTAATDARSAVTRTKNLIYGSALTLFLGFSYLYITDTRASVHRYVVVPGLRYIYPDPEAAHEAGTHLLKYLYSFGLHPRERGNIDDDDALAVTVFGHKLKNPIGTSAGIDKHGEVPDALLAFGGAVVEVGGTTPKPQDGNPKPRVFRLPEQKGLINRYGLNSLGAADMAMRLRERVRLFAYHSGLGIGPEAERKVLDGEVGVPPGSLTEGKLLLVQVAKNKATPENDIGAVIDDHVFCVDHLAKYADVLVVNVSSPNTPGLRALQSVEPLTKLLSAVTKSAQNADRKTKPKVMVKVSPDEDEDSQIEGIVEAIWRSGVDGVIVGNTTKRRNDVLVKGHSLSAKEQQILQEQGGYSGPQMFQRTLNLVKRYRTLLDQGPPREAESSADKAVTANASGDEPGSTIPEKAQAVVEKIKWNGEPKVIFATGGIANGKQALQILEAGASVAQVYTALIYGGVGTMTRIKGEMREELGAGDKFGAK